MPGLQGRANKHHILYIVMDETTKFVSHVSTIADCVDKRRKKHYLRKKIKKRTGMRTHPHEVQGK
jgi:hypothetical protein